MQRVLQNIDAPFSFWKTYLRNISNHSGIESTKFVCCRSHDLFPDFFVDEKCDASTMRPPCPTCEGIGTELHYEIFEFGPILPRLREWAKNPVNMGLRFDYLHENLFREDSRGDDLHYLYDGDLFMDII